jgi:hypothetical protein
MDFDTYIRLKAGMTEGELLTRAGKPDHISLDAVRRLRGGRIDNIERTKKN